MKFFIHEVSYTKSKGIVLLLVDIFLLFRGSIAATGSWDIALLFADIFLLSFYFYLKLGIRSIIFSLGRFEGREVLPCDDMRMQGIDYLKVVFKNEV